MKCSLLATALFVATGLSNPVQSCYKTGWDKVDLKAPADWIAGPRLFPGNVISGYNADYHKYNAKHWEEYILEKCKSFDQATSSISYSGKFPMPSHVSKPKTTLQLTLMLAINSGTPKERAWFGYCFRGGPTTKKDYVREHKVEHSVAYSKAC